MNHQTFPLSYWRDIPLTRYDLFTMTVGHTIRRCTKPAEDENASDGFGDGGFGNNPADNMGETWKDDGGVPDGAPSWMNAGDGGTTVPAW